MQELSIASLLDASPAALWTHASSPAGVNRELRPLLRMTFPADAGSFADTWEPGVRLFRSWILLFGVLPVEYDDLAFEEVEPGRRFLERSALATQRVWEHERVIEAHGAGARLTDRIRFAPRVALLGPLHRTVFSAVFRLRHHNLRRLFGGRALPRPRW